MMNKHEQPCDLVVIGAGMAGMAAALFASNRGIDTVQVGVASELVFASGLLDLMGVHPVETGTVWENPWNAVAAVSRDIPNHPYARIHPQDIQAALHELLRFMKQAGLPYRYFPQRNVRVITPVGTVKTTFCVPHTMWNNVAAFEEKKPCLLVDIRGLRGFSSRQISETLKPVWSHLRYATVSFPDTKHSDELYPEHMARSLAIPATRKALSDLIKPHIKNVKAVGLPAILGLYHSERILAELEEQLGLPVFEIPTMPPAVPGLRLKELFEAHLPENGVRLMYQKRVLKVLRENNSFLLEIGDATEAYTLKAKGIILAGGRFIGRGLRADRSRIRESLFDLPVFQPEDRSKWHRHQFLDPSGHLINQAGIEIDNQFRPLNAAGKPAVKNLYAAGSILAHQDWMRMKCGSGLAIATAYAAVRNFVAHTFPKSAGLR
jgi:glycerol-3-phosphate dehydrogenase subunit B